VAAADILAEVVQKFRPAAEAKGLEFDVQVEARPTLLAQAAHLRLLWTHLIDNAIRYTRAGHVRATLTVHEGQLVTTVADTGIGLSNEELARIFQEFYRAESARAEVELGTGLGLPIACQVVKIYQGTIWVDSVPGEGSTFVVSLPLAAVETGK
jgi:signal transduction histidine kinase